MTIHFLFLLEISRSCRHTRTPALKKILFIGRGSSPEFVDRSLDRCGVLAFLLVHRLRVHATFFGRRLSKSFFSILAFVHSYLLFGAAYFSLLDLMMQSHTGWGV